jgi:hypothetical protein
MLQFHIITDKSLRTRLMAIFSTCIITTVASLVHAVFVFTSSGVRVEMAGIVEVRMDHRLEPPDFSFSAELRVACRMQYTSHRHGLVTSTIINFTTTLNDFIIDHHVSFRRRAPGNSRQPPSWMTRSKSTLSHARAAHPYSNSINSGLSGEKPGPQQNYICGRKLQHFSAVYGLSCLRDAYDPVLA